MIEAFLGASAAFGLTLAAGLSILTLVWPTLSRNVAERLSLAFLLGSGIGVWFAASLGPLVARTGVDGRLVIVSAVALLSLIAWTRRAAPCAPPQKRGRTRRITLALAALLVAVFAVSLSLMLGAPHLPQTLSPFGSAPELSPLSQALRSWLDSWIPAPQVETERLFPAAFWLSLHGLFYGAVRRETTSPVALASCVGLAVVPAFVLGPGSSSSSAAAVPLAAYVFGATLCARWALDDAGYGYASLASVLAACASWSRPDGLALGLAVAVMFILCTVIDPCRRAVRHWPVNAVLITAAPIGAALLWAVLAVSVTPGYSAFVSGIPWSSDAASRSIAGEVLSLERWTAVWPAFALTTVIYGSRLRQSADLLVTGVVLITILGYGFVAVLAGGGVATALPHILLPVAPLALFATIGHLRAAIGRRAPGVEQPA